ATPTVKKWLSRWMALRRWSRASAPRAPSLLKATLELQRVPFSSQNGGRKGFPAHEAAVLAAAARGDAAPRVRGIVQRHSERRCLRHHRAERQSFREQLRGRRRDLA